jgi:uncharacterized protein with GYD domain
MAKYYLFGKYSQDALKQISDKRTQKAKEIIQGLGGAIKSMDALLGDHDLVFVIELPGSKEAVRASLALTKLTGISFKTSEAFAIDEFDKLASQA